MTDEDDDDDDSTKGFFLPNADVDGKSNIVTMRSLLLQETLRLDAETNYI